MNYPKTIINIIECFKKFPGIGEKTAERMALATLTMEEDALELFRNEHGQIDGIAIRYGETKNTIENKKFDFEDFLVNKGETATQKYGKILNKIIEITK